MSNDLAHNSVPAEVLTAFGIREIPVPLKGGQSASFRAGDCVLKWSEDADDANFVAAIMNQIREVGFRVARPVKSASGDWTYKGWSAFGFVEGKEIKGRWREKIDVSRKFHKVISHFSKPAMLARRQNPWNIADRMIWEETPLVYGEQLVPVMSRLALLFAPIAAAAQLIHADMSGNILFHEGLPPAIIDFSPYWRPAEYATAIIIADSIVWEGADDSLLDELDNTRLSNQLLIRAAMWRIKTTEEFIAQFGKGSWDEIERYSHFIDLLEARIPSQVR